MFVIIVVLFLIFCINYLNVNYNTVVFDNFEEVLVDKESLFNKIPKRFHFIWVSPFLNETDHSNAEDVLMKNIQTCLHLHPDWGYTIWTDNLIRGEFPELVDLLIAASVPSVMSDVLRMNIIARYGGIYFDTDFICLRSFETLLKQQFCTAFAGSEESKEDNVFDRLVTGALIGATPGHYLMKQAAKLILDVALDTMPPNIKTGPVFFGNITRRYNTSNECMYVYNKKPFYECEYWKRAECSSRIDEYKTDPDIYAMHLWAASWVV